MSSSIWSGVIESLNFAHQTCFSTPLASSISIVFEVSPSSSHSSFFFFFFWLPPAASSVSLLPPSERPKLSKIRWSRKIRPIGFLQQRAASPFFLFQNAQNSLKFGGAEKKSRPIRFLPQNAQNSLKFGGAEKNPGQFVSSLSFFFFLFLILFSAPSSFLLKTWTSNMES